MSDINIAGIIIAFSVSIILVFLMVYGIFFLEKLSRSWLYRRLFVDMFIVGIIKKFAKEEEFDLDSEIKNYLKFDKIEQLSLKSLDKVIESELNQKIANRETKK